MRWRTDAVTSLVVLAKRVQPLDLIASIDSAVHGGHITVQGLDELFSRLPRSARRLRTLVNGKSESGIESILRVAAIQRGWRVQVQVFIDGLGRADLLVDGWLIVETDGDEFHTSRAQRERDRARDAVAVRCGMRTHRFGYAQVMSDLEGCLDVIADLLAAGPPSHSSQLWFATGSRARPATGSVSYRPAVSG
jgi:very-short-patch-repair endonuclease